VLDDVTYKAVVAGFPILGLGIALGAYWGNIAWGRYWGWDPKETTALVTWLVFAGYLHARSLAQWRGTRAAWLVIVGFAIIIFNIFAVNFWIAGLHSYA
jgi:cytochrome c-type biogenesis protein CcsB